MMNIENSKIRKSTHVEIRDVLNSHMNSLAYPMDSFLENSLTESEIFLIVKEETIIGYAAVQGDYLFFFHIILQEFQSAPEIFEEFCKYNNICRVQVMTQDALMGALIAEWEYKKFKGACWFIDGGRLAILGA